MTNFDCKIQLTTILVFVLKDRSDLITSNKVEIEIFLFSDRYFDRLAEKF